MCLHKNEHVLVLGVVLYVLRVGSGCQYAVFVKFHYSLHTDLAHGH